MDSEQSETQALREESVSSRNSSSNQKQKKRTIRSESPPILRPYRHKPWKTIFLSFFLLFAGILFMLNGIEQTPEKGISETYPFFLLGILLLIPGVYHTIIIFFIWLGVRGFNYDLLPTLDN